VLVPALAAAVGLAGLAALAFFQDGLAGPEVLPIVGRPVSIVQQPIREDTGQGWRVVNTTSAHRMMVVDVDTGRIGEAVAIAHQIVGPLQERYDEVLVFFFEPGVTPRRASLRVQWTPRGGYRTLTLAPTRSR
jgi:hypothetical protein